MAKRLTGQVINIDGKSFQDTVFESCTLVYKGGDSAGFHNCEFAPPEFQFDGAAANTLLFLKALYHGGGQHIVEATFDEIRRNKPLSITRH